MMSSDILKDRHLTVRVTAEQIEISIGSVHAILCDHAQSDLEIDSQASVGGTEKLHLVVVQNLLDAINAEPGFLLFPKMKMSLKRSRFQSRYEIMQNETVNAIPKKAFQKCFR
ncbi:hypothetical protein TNCV_4167631 [Trichonephila clavipes]|nr:hypothetical protein TNCV_4167631 [Trichonephila clavipes]